MGPRFHPAPGTNGRPMNPIAVTAAFDRAARNASKTQPAHPRRKERKKTMKTKHALQIQWNQGRAWLFALVGLALGGASAGSALAEPADNRAPEVPDAISVGATNKVHFHGF